MSPKILRTSQDLQALPVDRVRMPHTEAQLAAALVESGIVNNDRDKGSSVNGHNGIKAKPMQATGDRSPEHRDLILSSRLGIPYVRVNEFNVVSDMLRRLPSSLIIRYKVMPLGMVGSHLVVAISDPTNLEAIQALNFGSETPVDIVVAPAQDINALIERYLLPADEEQILAELDTVEPTGSEPNLSEQDMRAKASQRPIVRFVDYMLHRAVVMGASDINIRPSEKGADIYFRIDGKLLLQRQISEGLRQPIVCRIKIMSGMNIAERRLPQDGHTTIFEARQRVDFRVSVIPMVNGESVVIRVLDTSKGLVSLDALGLPAGETARLRRILDHTFGIFLVTGPTGSGKSTTLYAVVNERKKSGPHIITVEDPVEYRIDGIEQIQIRPHIGYTFAEALRHILRHDPDEILIGEMRDYETAEIAIKASLTGHFVMSTLHTNDAPSTITRLLDMGIEPYLINSTLVGVLAQRLVRRLCHHCREPDPDDNGLKAYFNLDHNFAAWRGKGCPECHQTGYKGRMMVGELIEMTPALRALIGSRATADQIREQALADGMVPLAHNALSLVAPGHTSLEEAFAVKLE